MGGNGPKHDRTKRLFVLSLCQRKPCKNSILHAVRVVDWVTIRAKVTSKYITHGTEVEAKSIRTTLATSSHNWKSSFSLDHVSVCATKDGISQLKSSKKLTKAH